MISSLYKYVTGILKIRGGSDNTIIGNTSDRLKTEINLPSTYLKGVFGGLRTITTQNVFESLFSFNKQPLIWDEVLTGGATSTFNSNTNSIDMVLPTTSGASVVRQTFRRVRYNPSRAVQTLIAGTIGTGKTNVRRRLGQFDTSDGVFFEIDNLIAYCTRRTSTSGSTVDVRYAQSVWNIDKFDGTGPSGLTIDFSKHNLFYIQYAFQGFGDIVWGFYLNNEILFCHREITGNVLSLPFMKTAHLPMRLEFTNTGTSASSTTMSHNSAAAKNEGESADQEGVVLSYSNINAKTVGTTAVPVVSVRLGASFQKAIADLLSVNIYCITADEVVWTLYLNSALTGPTFAITNSYFEIDNAATALSGGTEILSGIISQAQGSQSVSQELLRLTNSLIGVSLAGSSNVLTLAAKARTGTADILSTLTWREYP